MVLAPGMVLAGRYRLERKVGEGGMGAVWLAKNLSVGTDVAVKTLTLNASANSEIVMRFRREAYLLSCVQSDHVCRVHDFASDDKHGHILVLDFIRGQSIHERLKERLLSLDEAIDVGVDVARGMLDLHRANIVHRDLKPGNVLLEPRSDGKMRALIVDFGLGRRMRTEEEDLSGITQMDTALGTLEYMAPEQILNSRAANPQADMYSLGAILYRSINGRHLFGDLRGSPLAQAKLGQDPPDFSTGRTDPVALGIEAIVRRCLRRKPAERYATTDELLADLVLVQRMRDDLARGVSSASLESATASPIAGTVPLGVASPPAKPESPWAKSVAPKAEPTPTRAERHPRRGVSGLAAFLIALGSMIAGATIGAYAERLRNAEARQREADTLPSKTLELASPPRASASSAIDATGAASAVPSGSADEAAGEAPSAVPSSEP